VINKVGALHLDSCDMSEERLPERSVPAWEDETEFEAIVEQYDMHPDECTIYPSTASEAEKMSTWITARGESFVSLEDRR